MDITKFCAPGDIRHYVHKPMRHEGYLYATTGHIAVRIEDDPAIEAEPMPANLLDVIRDQVKADEHEDAQSIFDAEFALMTGELLRLLPAVVAAMGGEIVEFSGKPACGRSAGT